MLDNKPGMKVARTAEGDITKGMALVFGTAETQAKAPGAANAVFFGAAAHDAASGERVEVILDGIVEMICSAAINAGQLVAIGNTDGEVAPVTVGNDVGTNRVVGLALSTTTGADQKVSVLLGRNGTTVVAA
jgi:predicted RecA/RadA family phage recombinase